jgi:hypothetical protein
LINYTHATTNYLMPHVAHDVALVWHSRPRGEIGIHARLKILCLLGLAGSSPAEGTTLKTIFTSLKIAYHPSYTPVLREKP